jgi:hypothetical protein
MSEVICFRLDSSNPREAQALMVLSAWQEAGFSRRHVLTEALIRLDKDPEDVSDAVAELREVLGRAHDLLEALQDGRHTAVIRQRTEPEGEPLAESFIASVRQAARPGMSSEGVKT